jgi:hypothetical protein
VIAKLLAVIIHEVAAEYRKLDAAQASQARALPEPAESPHPRRDDELAHLPSVTSADTERAAGWDHDKRHPVTAAEVRFGFGRPRP